MSPEPIQISRDQMPVVAAILTLASFQGSDKSETVGTSAYGTWRNLMALMKTGATEDDSSSGFGKVEFLD